MRFWSGLLLSLVMLLGVPICVYGALARGELDRTTQANLNEEREHEERAKEATVLVRRARRVAVPPPRTATVPAPIHKREIVEPPPKLRPSLVVHPSRFSERRLI